MTNGHPENDINKKIFELTYALYRVTALFPYQETLRDTLRREASIVLRDAVQGDVLPERSIDYLFSLIGKIRALRSLLWLARANHFVASINIDVIDREYQTVELFFASKVDILDDARTKKISSPAQEIIKNDEESEEKIKKVNKKDTIDKLRPDDSNKTSIKNPSVNAGGLNIERNKERKQMIMDILDQKDKSSIKDIAMSFSNVSMKTIQRDLNELIQENSVQRMGNKRWAVYSIRQN